MLNKIGIIGLGLIGGSLAKALKHYKCPATIYGYNRDLASLNLAYTSGSIDVKVTDFSDFSDCDLIVLCCPVEVNIKIFSELLPHLKKGVIVTDVGSTKGDIVYAMESFTFDGYFIGGHPMAGSEKSGFSATTAILFENAYYILTPDVKTPMYLLDELIDLIKTIGGLPLVIDPNKHDYVTATISHVPHLIASSLVNMVESLDDKDCLMHTLAAGGFKDITRIASASPQMWQEICLANQKEISTVLSTYIGILEEVQKVVETSDKNSLYDIFDHSKKYRNSFEEKIRGSVVKNYALYVIVEDEPGVIARIVNYLSDSHISIKNIGINNNREEYEGVLEILFKDQKSLDLAIEALNQEGIASHIGN